MVTGDARGGVWDYTEILTGHLRSLGLDVERVVVSGSTPARLRSVREASANIVHYQFPTRALGLGVAPVFLTCRTTSVVTLHESSALGPWPVAFGRVAPLTVGARSLIVTHEFDREWVARWMPWTRDKLLMAPIGNTVGIAPPTTQAPLRVVTFGLLRPWRGTERVPEFAELARARGHTWDVRVVGAFQDEYRAFGARIREAGEKAGVVFTGRLPEHEVAAELASAAVGYFPFPEGACERHGSLLAALANGLPVVTKAGARTTPALRDCIVPAQSPAEAVTAVARLMADPAERERLSAAGRAYAERFGWERIAQQHVELYERIAGAGGPG